MLLQMVECPFLWLKNIPWCMYIYIHTQTTFYLSIHLSVGTWVVSVLAVVNNAALMGVQVSL